MGTKYEITRGYGDGCVVVERESGPKDIDTLEEPRLKHVVRVIKEFATPRIWVSEPDYNLLVTKIVIQSPYLVSMLRKIATYYPDQSFDKPELTSVQPHKFLYHHFLEIRNYASDIKNEERTRKHAEILIRCLERLDTKDPGIISTMEKFFHEPSLPLTLPFDLVWLVYKPRTIILRRTEGNLTVRAYVIHSLSGCQKTYRGHVGYSTLVSMSVYALARNPLLTDAYLPSCVYENFLVLHTILLIILKPTNTILFPLDRMLVPFLP